MSTMLKIKNPYHDVEDHDYCKCEYSVYTPSIDSHALMYCTRCGKVITIYNPIVSEEHARQLEERARLEKLDSLLRSNYGIKSN